MKIEKLKIVVNVAKKMNKMILINIRSCRDIDEQDLVDASYIN